MPDKPLGIMGESTLYRVNKKTQEEEKALVWRKTARASIPPALMAATVKQAIKEIDLPRMRNVALKPIQKKDLLYVYLVGDHHIGMLSWIEETGSNYDIRIATSTLEQAFQHLTRNAESGSQALIVFLGDFLHFDSFEPLTVKNGNLLDADTRYPLMVRTAICLIQGSIEMCRQIHARVHVIIEQGNHDLSSMVMLREAITVHYSRLKTVMVDNTPGVYHYHRFGKNLIGTHHGDKIKSLQKLNQVMAHDRKQDWAETDHRTFLTGHTHQDRVLDLLGCRVESVRILPPVDAYAHELGYRSTPEMKALKLHAEHGEIARYTVKPSMFGDGNV